MTEITTAPSEPTEDPMMAYARETRDAAVATSLAAVSTRNAARFLAVLAGIVFALSVIGGIAYAVHVHDVACAANYTC